MAHREIKGGSDGPTLVRALLYGDVPLTEWRAASVDDVSLRFQAAAAAWNSDPLRVREILESLTQDRALDSRDSLQAWSALRQLGIQPDAVEAAFVLGVVVDIPTNGGLDTLAGYADGSVRYINYSGAMTFVEPGSKVTRHVLALVDAGWSLARTIGPWDGHRPALVPGRARVSLLCPDGLYFGDGPVGTFMTDSAAVPTFRAAMRLLHAVVEMNDPAEATS